MKKIFYLSLAAAALLSVGCTKENASVVGFPHNPDGTAFMSLAINLPTTPATKANDVFDDGESNEYAIEDAYLLIFAGTPDAYFTNQDAMTLRSAYELNSLDFTMDGNAQITTKKVVTAQILTENILDTEEAFAFVILNKHNFFSLDGINFKQGATSLTGSTFGAFKTILLDEDNKDFSNQSFTMTNMPHVHKTGMTSNPYNSSTPAPWTLVKIEKSKIKNNASDASTDPAAEIDVERVVAKVTVKSTLTGSGNTVTNGLYHIDDTAVNFEILGWFIDNTNKNAFVTRNTAEPGLVNPYEYIGYKATASSLYRMASATKVHDELSGNPVVRTYWGVDANYNADAASSDMNTEAGKIVNNTYMAFDDSHNNIGGRLRRLGTNYYCAENTFDVAHQTVKNTTRVIVATRFNGGASFYTFKPRPNYIYTQTELQDQVKDLLLARVNVINWLNKYVIAGATLSQKRSLLNVTVSGNGAGSSAEGTATITIALAPQTSAIDALIKSGETYTSMSTGWSAILADQNSYIAGNITPVVAFYETGVAYYQALIRHFDDTETPWTPNTSMTNNTASIYNGNNAADYLGRYGVLRNNWYDLNVASVKALGTPVVPELTDDPDDTVESYIAVKINVMPWAKRVQNVAL